VKLATLRALKNRVMEVETEINLDLLSSLSEGDAKAATLDDGTRLGKVSVARGPQTPAVVNEREFLTWVKNSYPSEITETVRKSFRTKVLESARTHGVAVDEKTGEVIPGVTLRVGNPYISFRGTPGWEQLVAFHWQELTDLVLALPGGES
jgi:hypothetical protein